MNNGLYGFPQPATWKDQTSRVYSMSTRPPLSSFLSLWLNASQCYTGSDLAGTKITDEATPVGSIANFGYAGGVVNAITPATFPIYRATVDGILTLYNTFDHYNSNAGMLSTETLDHHDFFVLMRSPQPTWGYYGGIVSGNGGGYGALVFEGRTTFYNNPLLLERNGADKTSTKNIEPIDEWFVLRYHLQTGPATSQVRVFRSQNSQYGQCAPMYIACAMVYDRELTSDEAETVVAWIQSRYPASYT